MRLKRDEQNRRRLHTYIIAGVPIEIFDRFKAVCARRHESMKKVLVNYMKQIIEADNEVHRIT